MYFRKEQSRSLCVWLWKALICVGEGWCYWESNETWWSVVREQLQLLLASGPSNVNSVFSPVNSTGKKERKKKVFRCNENLLLARELNCSSHCNEGWGSAAHGKSSVVPESFWPFLSQKWLIEMQLLRYLEPSSEVIQHSICCIRDHLQDSAWSIVSLALTSTHFVPAYIAIQLFQQWKSPDGLEPSQNGITSHLFTQITLADLY